MATNINRGNQIITFDYKHPAKGKDFNRLLYKLIRPGVYSGLDVSIAIGKKVNISSGYVFINSPFESETSRGVVVRFQTDIVEHTVNQSLANTDEMLFLYYEYKEVIHNWVDIRSLPITASLPPSAVVLARLSYDIDGNNITNVSYDIRNYGLYDVHYNINDVVRFSHSYNNSKKFHFDLSNISPNSDRKIRFPNYDYNINTIQSWNSGKNYSTNEIVLYNSMIWLCLVGHISSSSFENDQSNWLNLSNTSISDRKLVYNNTSNTINKGKFVKCISYNSSYKVMNIDVISSLDDTIIGIVENDIASNSYGFVITRGNITLNIDTSSYSVGTVVYADSNGDIVINYTSKRVGSVVSTGINSVIYIEVYNENIKLDITGFNGLLRSSEDTIQKAIDRIDDYTMIGTWSSGMSYRVGNVVRRVDDSSNSLWVCVTDHVSGSSFLFDITYWQPLTDYTSVKQSEINDLESINDNIIITNGTNSVLKNVKIDMKNDPVFNNITAVSLVASGLVSSANLTVNNNITCDNIVANNIDVNNNLLANSISVITNIDKGGNEYVNEMLKGILTNNEDIIIRRGGNITRLPVGVNGQILSVNSGQVTWINNPSISLNDIARGLCNIKYRIDSSNIIILANSIFEVNSNIYRLNNDILINISPLPVNSYLYILANNLGNISTIQIPFSQMDGGTYGYHDLPLLYTDYITNGPLWNSTKNGYYYSSNERIIGFFMKGASDVLFYYFLSSGHNFEGFDTMRVGDIYIETKWKRRHPQCYLANGSIISNMSTHSPTLFRILGGNRLPDWNDKFMRSVDVFGTRELLKTVNSNINYEQYNNIGHLQVDTFQGHLHYLGNAFYNYQANTNINLTIPNDGFITMTYSGYTFVPISDGVNGEPRTSNETRPRNFAVSIQIVRG